MAKVSSDTRQRIVAAIKGTLALGTLVFATQACQTKHAAPTAAEKQSPSAPRDDSGSRAAFLAAARRLRITRCLSCGLCGLHAPALHELPPDRQRPAPRRRQSPARAKRPARPGRQRFIRVEVRQLSSVS